MLELVVPGAMMDFFVPRPEFIDWAFESYGNRPWIDLGCGRGLLVSLLRHRGMRALGVDVLPSSLALIPDVAPMDARVFPIARPGVYSLCRPCRGDWIREVIERCVTGAGSMIYVGIHAEDLIVPFSVSLALERAGHDGEKAWVISE